MAITVTVVSSVIGAALVAVLVNVLNRPTGVVRGTESHSVSRQADAYSQPESGSAGRSRTRGTISTGSDLRVYANERGGYAFAYPAHWAPTTLGRDAELRDPAGAVTVSFSVAPAGELSDAATTVAERYSTDLLIVSSHAETSPEGLPAWVIAGIEQDATSRVDRVLSIAIDGDRENHAITVRFGPGRTVLALLPDIRRVISSYRVGDVN
ncbi:MAG TPA: hypothetical protein VLA82_14425 [Actinomycetota bacterium]|nr:hypothetical protein [Actinomycetota bacterium]